MGCGDDPDTLCFQRCPHFGTHPVHAVFIPGDVRDPEGHGGGIECIVQVGPGDGSTVQGDDNVAATQPGPSRRRVGVDGGDQQEVLPRTGDLSVLKFIAVGHAQSLDIVAETVDVVAELGPMVHFASVPVVADFLHDGGRSGAGVRIEPVQVLLDLRAPQVVRLEDIRCELCGLLQILWDARLRRLRIAVGVARDEGGGHERQRAKEVGDAFHVQRRSLTWFYGGEVSKNVPFMKHGSLGGTDILEG